MTQAASPLTQSLAQDIAVTLQSNRGKSVETVRRITDLFVRDSARYTSEHVAVFDDVLGLLINRIEEHARAELAERLADIPHAPPRAVKALAHDEISVARPILARSQQLTDTDLIDIAVSRGNDHMLAMTARRNLSAAVTDVLVERGDARVLHGAASNQTAVFSDFGFGTLVSRAREDDGLQVLIGTRPDLPIDHLRELVRQAKDTVRERLQATVDRKALGLIEGALEKGARRAAAETAQAMSETPSVEDGEAGRLFRVGELDETAIQRFARDGRIGDATAALGLLARLPMRLAERIFTEQQDDLLLLVCKSLGFAFATVAALQGLKAKQANRTPNMGKLQASYNHLSVQTAQRVVRFLHARDSLAPGTGIGAEGARLFQ